MLGEVQQLVRTIHPAGRAGEYGVSLNLQRALLSQQQLPVREGRLDVHEEPGPVGPVRHSVIYRECTEDYPPRYPLSSDGILVNAVSPGRIDTSFHDEFTPDEKREEGAQQIPLGREGTPEEVVGAVLFLASSQANYILGEVIEVNGGMLMD
jgi:hypothetical protein